MSSSTRSHCAQCGAPVKKKGMSVCWNCGTPYSYLDGDKEQAPREQRFDEIQSRPEFAQLKEHQPSVLPALLVLMRPILAGVVLVVVARLLRTSIGDPDAAGVAGFALSTVSVLLVIVALICWVVGGQRLLRFSLATRVQRTALVTRRRTLKPGGDLRLAQGKSLMIYLEFRTENRAAVRASGKLASSLQVDDIGLAYVKGEFLLAFRKLDAAS